MIIAQKYFERTGLNHEVKQLKNRWTQCKTMWQCHDWSQGEIGLGRNENGTIIADDDRWTKNTEVLICVCISTFLRCYSHSFAMLLC